MKNLAYSHKGANNYHFTSMFSQFTRCFGVLGSTLGLIPKEMIGYQRII